MNILDIMKNAVAVAVTVVGVFAAGWTACIEIKYLPEKDRNIVLEKEISSVESKVVLQKQNLKLEPEYLQLQKSLTVAETKIDEYQRTVSVLNEKLVKNSEALQTSITKNDIVDKIDELRVEKREVDKKLRCEVDHCYGFYGGEIKVDQKVVEAYKQQSIDLQEQIYLLIEQLSRKT